MSTGDSYTNKQSCVVLPHLAHHFGRVIQPILEDLWTTSWASAENERNQRVKLLREGKEDLTAKGLHNMEQAVRCTLSLAELDRQDGRLVLCNKRIEDASRWIGSSGSQEHLCMLHLVRGRLANSQEDRDAAHSALIDALHVSRHCRFALYHIDIQIELARLFLSVGRPDQAESATRTALNGVLRVGEETVQATDADLSDLLLPGALHPECDYAWGAAEAGSLLGQALLVQGKLRECRAQLHATMALQERIRDPKIKTTEMLHVKAQA